VQGPARCTHRPSSARSGLQADITH
jgi:hypothetical protein